MSSTLVAVLGGPLDGVETNWVFEETPNRVVFQRHQGDLHYDALTQDGVTVAYWPDTHEPQVAEHTQRFSKQEQDSLYVARSQEDRVKELMNELKKHVVYYHFPPVYTYSPESLSDTVSVVLIVPKGARLTN